MDGTIRLALETAAKTTGVRITYTRGGDRLCVIDDAIHSNAKPEIVTSGATIRVDSDDFIILADRLRAAGQRTEPEEADQIELVTGQSRRTFQVQSPGRGRQCFERMGTGPIGYRIHTKKISETP